MMRTCRKLCAILLICVAGAAQANAQTGTQALQTFYQKVHTLSAHFQQIVRDDNGNVIQQASGLFLLSRPQKFRWEYKQPYHQIMVSNGRLFKFYDVGLAQVTIRKIGNTLRATPALLLTGGEALEKAFTITDSGHRNGLNWVHLTPHDKDSSFKSIDLGLKNDVPALMRLHDNLGQTTGITFSDVRINPDLAASSFRLKIPKGVEIVDGRPNSGSGQGQ